MRYAALLLLALALVGCARPGEQQAEKAILKLLPEYLGPAKSYRTQVKGKSLGAVMRGRLREVHIVGEQVQLTDELTVRELTIDAEEVAADMKTRSLKGEGKATFIARIDERPLDSMAHKRRPKLADLRLTLRGRYVQVTVRPEVFGYPTLPITVDGTLAVRGGGKSLDFEPDRGRLTIIPIPEPVLDFVAERLNPVVDLSALTVPIRIEKAETVGGQLVLSGTIPPDEISRWTARK
ncbi:MAG: DUF2993 domain-containing protein [Armatimonas sp.]